MAKIPNSQVFLLLCFALCWGGKAKGYNIQGMFIFGSSVVDNGNNNYLNHSLAKVNYPPYGIDFPFGPTGRFCNGKTLADFIGNLLLLPLIPAFADPHTKGSKILRGVNYGSGGSGILDDTGSISGGKISQNEQIRNFEEVTLPELINLMGHKPAAQILDRYLFLVATGNNDLGLNYFLQNSSTRPTLPVFVANLTSTYASQLQRLYNAGARKFALLAAYPIGCSPAIKQIANAQECVDPVNAAASYFNAQLITMVDNLKQKLPGSEFVVVNAYNIILDLIRNPFTRGFSNVTSGCCELREVMGVGITCKEGGKVCRNRGSYVYFDGLHNTEAANAVIAQRAVFSVRQTDVYPFNLLRLALL